MQRGHVHVKQTLLNRLQEYEKYVAIAGAREQLDALKKHLDSEQGTQTRRISQSIKVGNHSVHCYFYPNEDGVRIGQPNYKNGNMIENSNILIFAMTAIILGILFLYFGR